MCQKPYIEFKQVYTSYTQVSLYLKVACDDVPEHMAYKGMNSCINCLAVTLTFSWF